MVVKVEYKMTYRTNIHNLLNDVFNEQELRDFCFLKDEFRPVHDQLREEDRKAEILNRLLEFADKKNLIERVLTWAKAENLEKYQQYQPYQAAPAPSNLTTADSSAPEAPSVKVPVTYPQELTLLREALARRSLSLFIGADLPQAVTGLPSRTDLAQALARRKGLAETLTLAEVTQRLGQGGNRWEFTDFIRTQLDTMGRPPQEFQQQIVSLVKTAHIETILTTTYDNLLELAFQQARVGLNRVIQGSDLNFVNPGRSTLLKLYGDLQQTDSLVVTEQDHSKLLRDQSKEGLIDEVKQVFRRSTVLFLGYDFADPDFRFLFDQIAASRFARTAYAVWPDLSAADVQMWRERSLVVMDLDPLLILAELTLEELED